MSRIIGWFARSGIAANLLMVLIIVGGLATLPGLKEEVFPEFSSDTVQVTVTYLGAAPEEVEEGVCIRVEEAVYGLAGIKRITSRAVEGFGTVAIEVLPGVDTRQLLDEVKARVDAIDTFPEETEKPVVEELVLRRQVIDVAVSGNTDEHSLRLVAERVRDEIAALPGISLVELAGARPYEISIEVPEEVLRRHALTFDQVAAAVRRSSLDLPGGSVKTAGGEILVRTKGQAYRGREFEELPLLSRPDGTRLRLGDVATVIDGFEDTDQASYFDGKPAILVQVFRVGDQGALEIAGKVKDYVTEVRSRLPEGISLTTWQDDSAVLASRLSLLVDNGINGLLLVCLSLALFLRLKLALWVAWGIPLSFLGAVWVLPAIGISINLISLFAFIVVLGIVVDDAIVVGENIYAHFERGKPPLRAAIDGACEVATPVVFAVLTSVAAFAPLLTVPGNTGKIMAVIPAIVIVTLAFSLVESLLILPTHLSHLKRQAPGRDDRLLGAASDGWYRFQGLFAGGLALFARQIYVPVLRTGLRWRYLVFAGGVALLLLTAGLVASGRLKFVLFPPVDADNVVAFVTMPQGTSAETTERAVAHLAASARRMFEVEEQRHGTPLHRHIVSSVGGQPYREAQDLRRGRASSSSGGHRGEVNIELAAAETRALTSTEIARRWRDEAGPIADAVELAYTSSLFSAGEPINVQLASPSVDDLRTAAGTLESRLGEYAGVDDITNSFRAGKREVTLEIRPEAEALGLSLADLARQVRQGFYGEEAQRIQRGRDDVRIMVRYPKSERRSLGDLEAMRIRTPSGAEVPFPQVARARYGRGYASIERVDRQRTIKVTADVDQTMANANEILADLAATTLPELVRTHPGLGYTLEGEQREQRETFGGLRRGFLIALVMIYALLAIPFGSYFQPLIVMSAIPFGIVGVIAGHMILGLSVTILSLFGVVALTGVVVNDSLVMVDFINRRRREAMSLEEAVREAGLARFRPIFLTSLTTFVGLSPLLFEKSMQAQFLIPMAASLGFGVVFATVITLMIVPVAYLILEDIAALVRGAAARPDEVPAAPRPARDSSSTRREVSHDA